MNGKRVALIAAMLVGLAAGPAVALTAANMVGAADDPVAATAVAAEETPAGTAAFVAVEDIGPVGADDPAAADPNPAADLETACVVDGPELVQAETDGTITPVEQAALDALRPICRDAGHALAGPAAPEAQETVVVKTVTMASGASGSRSGSGAVGHEDDDYEDDDDYYEDEDGHGGSDDHGDDRGDHSGDHDDDGHDDDHGSGRGDDGEDD